MMTDMNDAARWLPASGIFCATPRAMIMRHEERAQRARCAVLRRSAIIAARYKIII